MDTDTDTVRHAALGKWTTQMLAAVGLASGAGYIGHDILTPDERPAVLAQGVERLQMQVSRLETKVDRLTVASGDRWRRSDHNEWETVRLEPRLRDLDARLRACETRWPQ